MEKKDERILKKVGKLLKLYGVTDEEKDKFLMDLQDKKYDDQEEIEEVSEEEVEPTESMGNEEEPMEAEPTEDMVTEDVGETPDQEPVEEAPMEQPNPMENTEPVEEPTPEPMGEVAAQPDTNEETQKTIDGLVARIESLEDIIKKMGVKVEDSFGTSPANESSESYEESEFDRINRLRRGN